MQPFQNNVVRTVLKLYRNVLVHSSIKHLQWLKVSERVTYKIAVLPYNAINANKPSYLVDVLHIQKDNSTTRLSTPLS